MKKSLKIFILFILLTFIMQGCKKEVFHKVTFDSDGGSFVQGYEVLDNTSIGLITPTKEGYTFVGWYTSHGFKFTTNDYVTEDITLVARWEAKSYNVYIMNSSDELSNIIPLKCGEAVNITIYKVGYTFLGLYLDKELTEKFTLKTMPARDITLYSKFEKNQYIINFENATEQSIAIGFNETITLPTPEKTGFLFKGWYKDIELTEEFDQTYMPAENITLYAKWEVIQYKITFYEDTNEPTYIYKNFNEELSNLYEPNKYGYTFLGWYLDETLTTSVSKMPANDISLYPKWKLNPDVLKIENEKELFYVISSLPRHLYKSLKIEEFPNDQKVYTLELFNGDSVSVYNDNVLIYLHQISTIYERSHIGMMSLYGNFSQSNISIFLSDFSYNSGHILSFDITKSYETLDINFDIYDGDDGIDIEIAKKYFEEEGINAFNAFRDFVENTLELNFN